MYSVLGHISLQVIDCLGYPKSGVGPSLKRRITNAYERKNCKLKDILQPSLSIL